MLVDVYKRQSCDASFGLIGIEIIESHDFCIQNSDIGGDKFSITIYPDSVGCNSIGNDCNIFD